MALIPKKKNHTNPPPTLFLLFISQFYKNVIKSCWFLLCMFSANLEIAVVLSQSNKKQDLDRQCWFPTVLSVKSWRKTQGYRKSRGSTKLFEGVVRVLIYTTIELWAHRKPFLLLSWSHDLIGGLIFIWWWSHGASSPWDMIIPS